MNKPYKVLLAALSAAILLLPPPSWADGPEVPPTCTILWDAVTARVDGSAVVPAKYTVYMGTTPDNRSAATDVTDTDATATEIGALADGQYYVSITATDADGLESAHSTVLAFVIKTPSPPNAPMNVRVQ